jgi:hypothetical protein
MYLARRAHEQDKRIQRNWLVTLSVASALWCMLTGSFLFNNPGPDPRFDACNAP